MGIICFALYFNILFKMTKISFLFQIVSFVLFLFWLALFFNSQSTTLNFWWYDQILLGKVMPESQICPKFKVRPELCFGNTK